MLPSLKISIRRLVESVVRQGDLRRGQGLPPDPAVAAALHRALQKSRGPGYQSEVPLALTLAREGRELTVGGRVDGLWAANDPPLLEEIKTFRRPGPGLEPLELARAWAQLRAYGHLYAVAQELPRVTLRLTLCPQNGRGRAAPEPISQDETLSAPELARFFASLLDPWLDRQRELAAWRRRRNLLLAELPFPFPVYRPGQRDLAVAVYRAAGRGGRLLAQAATGSGKTLATLFPALKALAHGLADQVIYLTAKNTGKDAVAAALAQLMPQGPLVRAVILASRAALCPQMEADCRPECCPRAAGHFDRVGAAARELAEAGVVTPAELAPVAERHRVCPAELALDLAAAADVVAADYNHLLDPLSHLSVLHGEALSGALLLIDEAHNLAERAPRMFSAGLDAARVDAARAEAVDLPLTGRALARLTAALERQRQRLPPGPGHCQSEEPPRALLPLLEEALAALETDLAQGREVHPWLWEFYLAGQRLAQTAREFGPDMVTLWVHDFERLTLRLFCREPGPRLERVLGRARAVALFSSTLTPPAYHCRLLGGPAPETLGLAWPFPPENLRVLAARRVNTRFRQRAATSGEVAALVTALVRARRGGYLVFFPSYQYLELVRPALTVALGGAEILAQHAQMDEAARREFLWRLSHPGKGTRVGLTVLGGAFGEGVDFPPDCLAGAAVVGVGLPGPGPEREALRRYYGRALGQGFEYAYLYPGLNRVVQAVGRLIRSPQHRAVVLLLDQRYASARYTGLLPSHWRPQLVDTPAQVTELAGDFWSGVTEKSAARACASQ
ncbi:MAG: ATP-dependent DNA helicase [Deltaproteobacteria bacterium]|nr:ATP-dependent DNA helicase [Deltaproteobacteria bacterium]